MTLLFLDIDGTMLPFGGDREHPRFAPRFGRAVGHPMIDRVDPSFGPRLAELGCGIVWATTWMEDANDDVRSTWAGCRALQRNS
ncbi:MAG: hypothetical protein ACT4QF_05895 [Sporichthyaceae bacterium]